jgi:hypothetical protein
MIEEGADGGSRSNLMQGAMAGHSVISFVPLHLLALERSESLEQCWTRSWWEDDVMGALVKLSPEGCFDEEGQRDGCFLWSPPPAAAMLWLSNSGRRGTNGQTARTLLWCLG